ncbi:DUF2975 domain-containing protein [Pontixanthobacter aestiaquae]|uniref:DUF2975 domain-containing protein n=1 Tax=Pontixanthobacter aestiaquae TaxID=1509367 RepID=A0A844YZG6_9SPHN|nr:DUF2975 domain-containing protein [Pontixanthobacter aestiaquae]MDN3647163.1 DUF2975 domain-containing protein [Pontixanthobacter aestiaquae]MXO81861.1 DUF2975 domain-containing protein [Pontixanthobacter aestiaquae]
MTTQTRDPLLAAGRIIILLAQGLFALGAAALTIGFPIVLFMQGQFTEELQAEIGNPELVFPTSAILGLMLLALIVVIMAFFFLNKMRLIIDTVADGDPFVPDNSERLTAMAWLMLAIQILAIPAAGLALYITKVLEDANATIDAGIDLNGVIMVVVLFILARVFRHGTAMREDLEGTV